MHAETNICIKREAYQSVGSLGFQQMAGPVFWGSATLGHIILGLAILLSLLIIRIELNVSKHRVKHTISRGYSVPSAQVVKPLTSPYGKQIPRFPRTGCGLRSLSLIVRTWLRCYPSFPFCYVLSELSTRQLFLRTSVCVLWICAGPGTKGAGLSVLGSSISIPRS